MAIKKPSIHGGLFCRSAGLVLPLQVAVAVVLPAPTCADYFRILRGRPRLPRRLRGHACGGQPRKRRLQSFLQFPIILNDDVQIINRTDDGFYIIKYKKNDGTNSVIWLPDTFESHSNIDSKGSAAISMVKVYINKLLILNN